MLLLKAWHIIAVVAWFAGLFYLPRLFVYHSEASDAISLARFKIMERRLYYGIMWPAAIISTILGLLLFSFNTPYYAKAGWMHVKLTMVFLLWVYHILCGHYVSLFAKDANAKRPIYFRIFNEFPTLLLITIVLLVVMKPF